MLIYWLRTVGAHFRSGRVLYLLTVGGVALGVASVLTIQIINRNAIAAFQGNLHALHERADLSVIGRTPVLPDTLYRRVLATEGVASARPLIRVTAVVAGSRGLELDVHGVDLYAPSDLPISRPEDRTDPRAAPYQPGIAVSTELARAMGWRIGDSLVLTSGMRRVATRVTTQLDFRSIEPMISQKLALMDIADAQDAFGLTGVLHQIDIRLRPGVDDAEFAARLADRMGPAVAILSDEERTAEAVGILRAFRMNLTALSLISVFVGLFLVYSCTQAALVRRRTELGVLRTIGASRLQVLALILGEVLVLGILGVALGIPVGWWAATANVDIVSATITNLYMLQEIEAVRVPSWMILLGAVVGTLGAIAGALAPALDLSRRDPMDLLATFTLHRRTSAATPALALIGLALLIATIAWYVMFGSGWQPSGFVLATAVVLSLPLLAPHAIRTLAGWVPVRGFGLTFSLQSLGSRLPGTTVAVGALSVAVAMLVGITIMVASFRSTLDSWIQGTIGADVYLTTESWRGYRDAATLDDAVIDTLRALPEVVAVDRRRGFRGYTESHRIRIASVDGDLAGGSTRFALLDGRYSDVFESENNDAVLISEPLSRKTNVATGDTIVVAGPDGAIPLHVAGVFSDYGNEQGALVTSHQTLTRHFGPGGFNSVALYLAAGVDGDRFVNDVRSRFAATPLVIRDSERIRREALNTFDQTFAITRLLRGMSLIIAGAGITLTLLILARERFAELALFRAIGASRWQIFAVFLGKGVGLGLVGALLGSVGGFGLAAILVFIINPTFFGWTLQPLVPWGTLSLQILIVLAAAAAAGIYPSARASRTPARELSRDQA